MNALLGGYFCGWYLLLGVGYVTWLQMPGNATSWWTIAFGALAYVLLIPSLLFGMMEPVFGTLSARLQGVIEEATAAGTIKREWAFALGLLCSAVAMTTCLVGGWSVAMVPERLSTENLGETGVAVAMMAILVTGLAIIALCPWLGMRYLATWAVTPSRRRVVALDCLGGVAGLAKLPAYSRDRDDHCPAGLHVAARHR